MANTKINAEGYQIFEDSGNSVHRWVAEKKHNMKLTENLEVHHLNHDKKDNRKQNLIVLNREDHYDLHQHENKINLIVSSIIFLGIIYFIPVLLGMYTSLPVNLTLSRICVFLIILLALELKFNVISRAISRPNEKAR